ncbi:unnamed protein product [Prorocentrum cordatum]|uniref:Nascent polypeptide-associated complex subunit alpha, muscle-specific form-like n=1 Tax=Prorocentrum cordatum TaxID=2364126 RepID=A0ABN9VLE3_9DINO|nr:unnamed protein product [Polarella glacialis]
MAAAPDPPSAKVLPRATPAEPAALGGALLQPRCRRLVSSPSAASTPGRDPAATSQQVATAAPTTPSAEGQGPRDLEEVKLAASDPRTVLAAAPAPSEKGRSTFPGASSSQAAATASAPCAPTKGRSPTVPADVELPTFRPPAAAAEGSARAQTFAMGRPPLGPAEVEPPPSGPSATAGQDSSPSPASAHAPAGVELPASGSPTAAAEASVTVPASAKGRPPPAPAEPAAFTRSAVGNPRVPASPVPTRRSRRLTSPSAGWSGTSGTRATAPAAPPTPKRPLSPAPVRQSQRLPSPSAGWSGAPGSRVAASAAQPAKKRPKAAKAAPPRGPLQAAPGAPAAPPPPVQQRRGLASSPRSSPGRGPAAPCPRSEAEAATPSTEAPPPPAASAAVPPAGPPEAVARPAPLGSRLKRLPPAREAKPPASPQASPGSPLGAGWRPLAGEASPPQAPRRSARFVQQQQQQQQQQQWQREQPGRLGRGNAESGRGRGRGRGPGGLPLGAAVQRRLEELRDCLERRRLRGASSPEAAGPDSASEALHELETLDGNLTLAASALRKSGLAAELGHPWWRSGAPGGVCARASALAPRFAERAGIRLR